MSRISENFKTPKLSDEAVVQALQTSLKDTQFGIQQWVITLRHGHSYTVSGDEPRTDKNFKAILDLAADHLQTIAVDAVRVNSKLTAKVTWSRNINHAEDSLNFDYATPTSDDARVDALRAVANLRKTFLVQNSVFARQENATDESGLVTERLTVLRELESIQKRAITGVDEYRTDLDRRFDTRVQELQKQFSEKESLLQKERDDLEVRIKALDDRASKHLRRSLREETSKKIQRSYQNFSLSESTKRLRRPVQWLVIGLNLVFASLFVVASLVNLGIIGTNTDPWLGIARQALFGLAFASAAIYHIRWNSSWFQKNASEEFQLKRLELDLDRASYAVEMALEFSAETKQPIPDLLLEKITANLFGGENEKPLRLHPAEDLLTLLTSSSTGAKITMPNGSQFEMNHKGLQRLSDSLNSNESSH